MYCWRVWGVLEVPSVLQGPFTHNPAWVYKKPHTSKKWRVFSLCKWKMGVSAPFCLADLLWPNWPQCAESHAVSQSPSSTTEKLQTFQRNIFAIENTIILLRFSRCWPYLVTGILFDESGCTRKVINTAWIYKKPHSGRCCWADMAIFTGTGAIFTHAGSSVGTPNNWILFPWSIAVNF